MAGSDRRDKQQYWVNDAIEYLPRVGKRDSFTHTQLTENNIYTIGDLAGILPEDLPPICGICGLHAATSRALAGSCPNISGADHRTADNPYESKYGENWEDHIRKIAAMAPFRPVSDLIEFRMVESERIMTNMVHESNGFFIRMHYLY